jgi:hypothetical protein
VVDDRRDHSFRVPRPDLSRKVGSPDPCTGCHHDRDTGWATEAASRWHGPDGRQGRPHYGEVLHAGRTGEGSDTEGRLLGLAGDSQAPAIVRATALDLLTGYLTERSLLTLSRAVGDADPLVRRAALGTLEALPPAMRLRLGAERLADPVRDVRLEAARVLAELTRSKLPEARQRALAAALDEYRTAQGFAAEQPEAHLNLGLLAIRTGDAAGAESAYRRSLALDPAFVPGYLNLADLYRARGQEALDGVAVPALLVEQGAGHAAEGGGNHHVLFVAEPSQGRVQGVRAHGPVARPDTGEDVPAASGQWGQFPQDLHGLAPERHQLLVARLHPLARDPPHGAVQVELCPLGTPQLPRAHENEGGRDLRYRGPPDPGEDVPFQPTQGPVGVALCPSG